MKLVDVIVLFVGLLCSHGCRGYLMKTRSAISHQVGHKLQMSLVQSKPQLLPPWLPSFGTAALGGLLFGSDIGSSSSVVRILGSGTSEFGDVSALQLGEVASSSLFGAMVASLAIIQIGDTKIGRKTELIIASILFLLGTILQSSATTFDIELIGRALYGLGIGTAMHVAPLFIAETSPSNIRGRLVSLKEAAIVLGIVLGYAAGALFGSNGNWHAVFASVLPLEVLMLLGAFIVPESSRWLALRGRKAEAIENLKQVQGIDDIEATSQVSAMMQSVTAATKDASSSIGKFVSDVLASKSQQRALTIGVGLVLFQQLSGQPSVLYFANRIFESAGLGFEAALGVGIFKLIMTLVSAGLVEDPNWGRKPLLIYGSIAMTASLVAIASLFAFFDPTNISIQYAIISCILVYVGGYQIGYGPITWLVLSEIFPLQVRSAAVSVGTLTNFGSNLLVALLFEIERQSLGEASLFTQFAIVSAIATIFISKQVFETRGLSLEEIELKLNRISDSSSNNE
jgi:sugar porter (SP) family MFS transporter